jgi:predicted Rossmann fold flavoprotein
MTKFDLIIIGGGAAGMMAAISAKHHHPEVSVAILDRTFALGRKILVCGAGRCNVTNIHLDEAVEKHYYGANPQFIQAIFEQFGFKDIVGFFEELGVALYVERKTDVGKMFPITDQAHTVNALLQDELQRLGVEVFLLREVAGIMPKEHGFSLKVKNLQEERTVDIEDYQSTHLIIAAGGKTYPALGSNGTGYDLARNLGHNLIDPVPSALPLECSNQLSHLLQGQRAEATVTSLINGIRIKSRTDDVMFTQYGFSGPAILNISRELSIHLNREHGHAAELELNFLPGHDSKTALQMLEARWLKRPDQMLEQSLYGLLTNKFASAALQVAKISNKPVAQLSAQDKASLLALLTAYRVRIPRTRSWNEAEFTAGGVDTDEIKPNTLESQKHNNLYFAGEIMDVDGDVGGFNLSWGWASGWVAGKLS